MENSVVIHKVIESIRCSTVADKGKNKERVREGESMTKQTKIIEMAIECHFGRGIKSH